MLALMAAAAAAAAAEVAPGVVRPAVVVGADFVRQAPAIAVPIAHTFVVPALPVAVFA